VAGWITIAKGLGWLFEMLSRRSHAQPRKIPFAAPSPNAAVATHSHR
jgi:hypothetical protein